MHPQRLQERDTDAQNRQVAAARRLAARDPAYAAPAAALEAAHDSDPAVKTMLQREALADLLDLLAGPATAEEGQNAPDDAPLPTDFPALALLKAKGFRTYGHVRAHSREDLDRIEGIGEKTAGEIQAAAGVEPAAAAPPQEETPQEDSGFVPKPAEEPGDNGPEPEAEPETEPVPEPAPTVKAATRRR